MNGKASSKRNTWCLVASPVATAAPVTTVRAQEKDSNPSQEHRTCHQLSTLWSTLAEYLLRHSRSKSIGIQGISCDAPCASRALKHSPSQARQEQVHAGSASFH